MAESRQYTKEETERLLALYRAGSPSQEISAALGRSVTSVRNKLLRMGVHEKRQSWAEHEIQFLVDWYKQRRGKPIHLSELAKLLGRSRASVACFVNHLGLADQKRLRVLQRKDRRKFKTREELIAHLRAGRKEWYRTHAHPRGMLGKTHSPETKMAISEHSRRWNAQLTLPEKERIQAKAMETNMRKYGVPWVAAINHSENPYSSAKRGKRADLGNYFFRSRWEANYARYLNFLIVQGQIKEWRFEPRTFVFPGVTRGAISYLPDFQVFELDGSYIWHEVKGWMKSIDRTRLKRMAKYYPNETVILIQKQEYNEIEKKLGRLIEHWEFPGDPIYTDAMPMAV